MENSIDLIETVTSLNLSESEILLIGLKKDAIPAQLKWIKSQIRASGIDNNILFYIDDRIDIEKMER